METETIKISEEFKVVIKEFINDILITFPEYQGIMNKWWNPEDEKSISYIYNYCVSVYPERFFEILYQNVDLFSKESNYNTEFLPGISFRYLWSCNISDKTRETIWKYLQLILISLIGTIKDKSLFGDTSKLLENMNETEFKNKLEETMNNIQSVFSNKETDNDSDNKNNSNKDFQLPSSDHLHEHMSTMLNGKLGSLAKEIAEETVNDFNIDMNDETVDPQQLLQKLFSEPEKLMNLVKTVGSKLDDKIKNGDMNQSELFSEASNMFNQMRNVPGMDNIQEMIAKMGLGGGKKTKINKNAMETKIKLMNTRDKLKKKAEERHMNKILTEAAEDIFKNNNSNKKLSDEELVSLFKEKEKKSSKKSK